MSRNRIVGYGREAEPVGNEHEHESLNMAAETVSQSILGTVTYQDAVQSVMSVEEVNVKD